MNFKIVEAMPSQAELHHFWNFGFIDIEIVRCYNSDFMTFDIVRLYNICNMTFKILRCFNNNCIKDF